MDIFQGAFMTAPKERAEIKAREIVDSVSFIGRFHKDVDDKLIEGITQALLEFSQGSTVVPSYEEINEAAEKYADGVTRMDLGKGTDEQAIYKDGVEHGYRAALERVK
jgi:hypothetical protein